MTDEEFHRMAVEVKERLALLDKKRNEMMREAAQGEPSKTIALDCPLVQ